MPSWTVIRADALTPMPWRNGHGTSRDIVSRPRPDGTLGWTVSIADLERDAPFSHYPHGDRIFTPIAGDPPPALAFDGDAFEPCPLLVPKRFSGEVPTLSRIASPGRAFNVIVDRRFYAAQVTVHVLAPGDEVPASEACHVLVHCLTGALPIGGDRLAPGDSLLGSGPRAAPPASEATTILVVEIRRI